jgi:hypothetical protein
MANQATKMISTLPNLAERRNQQKIAAVAYEFWLARAFRGGSPAEDWLRAHQKVRCNLGNVRLRRTTVGDFLVS